MVTSQHVITHNPIVDTVLSQHSDQLGADAATYRNHVMRCLNYYALLTDAEVPDDVALAWAVHDLGIWTSGTFDYLGPSALLARDLAPSLGITNSRNAEELVLGHHHLLPFSAPALEAFRRADLIDVSRGLLRNGLKSSQIKEVVAAFPYIGFHRFLASGLFAHAIRHPLRPLPMMRIR